MFSHDHKADLDVVLDGVEKATADPKRVQPFALIRFGDGEVALMDGRAHRSADAWTTKGPVWLQAELFESLQADLDRFCIGLPCPCCISRGISLRGRVAVPPPMQTYATLFLHGNLPRAKEILERFDDAVVVNDRYGEIRVPSNGVTEPWDVDRVVNELLEVQGRPVFLAAGPCSNLIAYRYWQRQDPKRRVCMIDIGSALDYARGDKTRHYHGTMDHHTCFWHEKSRPFQPTRPVTPQRLATGGRIVVGRTQQSENAEVVKPPTQRLRIGKP